MHECAQKMREKNLRRRWKIHTTAGRHLLKKYSTLDRWVGNAERPTRQDPIGSSITQLLDYWVGTMHKVPDGRPDCSTNPSIAELLSLMSAVRVVIISEKSERSRKSRKHAICLSSVLACSVKKIRTEVNMMSIQSSSISSTQSEAALAASFNLPFDARTHMSPQCTRTYLRVPRICQRSLELPLKRTASPFELFRTCVSVLHKRRLPCSCTHHLIDNFDHLSRNRVGHLSEEKSACYLGSLKPKRWQKNWDRIFDRLDQLRCLNWMGWVSFDLRKRLVANVEKKARNIWLAITGACVTRRRH